MRLSIATKTFLAFATVITAFTSVLMFGTYRAQELYGRIQQLNQTVVPVSLLLSDVQTDLKSFSVLLNERDVLVLRRTLQMTRLVYFLPDQFTDKADRASQIVQTADLDDMQLGDRPLDLTRRLEHLRDRAVAFSSRSEAFTQLVLNEDASDDPQQYRDAVAAGQDSLRDRARQLDSQIASLRADLSDATDTALARARDNQRSSLYALSALSALTLLLAIAFLVAVIYTLRPLTALTAATKRIGEGDYRPIVGIDDRRVGHDEITTLAEEFNSMAVSLAERDQKLRAQHDRLLKSERLATIGQMTSLITHELRNPLSSINLNTEMLQEALLDRGIDPGDDDVMPLLRTIIDEVDRLSDITEEYLVYARLPSPTLHPRDLGDIVESLIDFHAFEWSAQGVRVQLHLPAHPILVRADANQLRQALLNILRNAVEASPSPNAIEVSLAAAPDTARISVRDHGPGVDAATRERIFEPFFTTKASGTGIGLAMTQQIVEEHHGHIRVENPAGGGACFTVELPRLAQDPS